MAASPTIKVYSSDNEYLASCKYYEDAAALAALRGDGTTIRNGHNRTSILWTEGREPAPAAESYDYVGRVCEARLAVKQEAAYLRSYAQLPEGYVPARERYAAVFASLGDAR